MSDKNLTQLAQLASLNTGDLFYFVRPGSGINGDFSIGLSDLVAQITGNINPYQKWNIVNSNFTGVIGQQYQVNCSGGSITGTLPNNMIIGDWMEVQDATFSFSGHPLVISTASVGLGWRINGILSGYTDAVVGDKLSIVAISSGYGVSIK